jgi:dihydrofolate reductase
MIFSRSRPVDEDVASDDDEVRRLRDDHNLLINGSGELVHALVRHGLIDDYRIWIHPVVVGAGKRLFGDGVGIGGLSLREIRRTTLAW